MELPSMAAMVLAEQASRQQFGLVMAMSLAYVLCFAGMIFAYVSYRRRQRLQKKDEERKP